MKRIGKQKTSSLNPATTQKKKKNNFEQQPFSVTAHQAPVTDQNIDLSGYRKPQPGEAIANVMRSIEAGTANKPVFTRRDNELTAPPRQNYQPIINPIRQLTAPRPDSNGKGQIVQTKLTIGRPNDKYEQEADRVATQVVRQINRPAPMSMAQGGMVQGKEEEPRLRMKAMTAISEIEAMPEEGEIQQKSMVRRREAIGGGEASAELSGEINRARGGGQPLDAGLQQSIGQAMGADFSGVRVHTDERADRLNRSLSSRAFTTGQDMFFKKGEYQPGRRSGQELIAHELTHVKQQKKSSEEGYIQRCWEDEYKELVMSEAMVVPVSEWTPMYVQESEEEYEELVMSEGTVVPVSEWTPMYVQESEEEYEELVMSEGTVVPVSEWMPMYVQESEEEYEELVMSEGTVVPVSEWTPMSHGKQEVYEEPSMPNQEHKEIESQELGYGRGSTPIPFEEKDVPSGPHREVRKYSKRGRYESEHPLPWAVIKEVEPEKGISYMSEPAMSVPYSVHRGAVKGAGGGISSTGSSHTAKGYRAKLVGLMEAGKAYDAILLVANDEYNALYMKGELDISYVRAIMRVVIQHKDMGRITDYEAQKINSSLLQRWRHDKRRIK